MSKPPLIVYQLRLLFVLMNFHVTPIESHNLKLIFADSIISNMHVYSIPMYTIDAYFTLLILIAC